MASELTENKGELNLCTEAIWKMLGRSKHTCAALYLATIEKIGEKFISPAGSKEQLFEQYERLKKKLLVVSNKYNDHLCFAVAEKLEKAFGGWVCPSQIQEK